MVSRANSSLFERVNVWNFLYPLAVTLTLHSMWVLLHLLLIAKFLYVSCDLLQLRRSLIFSRQALSVCIQLLLRRLLHHVLMIELSRLSGWLLYLLLGAHSDLWEVLLWSASITHGTLMLVFIGQLLLVSSHSFRCRRPCHLVTLKRWSSWSLLGHLLMLQHANPCWFLLVWHDILLLHHEFGHHSGRLL